jgi:hypothetical protein
MFGGGGGGVHVLVYDAVNAETIVILRAGQLKTVSNLEFIFLRSTVFSELDC